MTRVKLFDLFSGRQRLAPPAPHRLLALSAASATLGSACELRSAGRAGIVFKSGDGEDFQAVVDTMEGVVRAHCANCGMSVSHSDDSFGYSWLVLEGPEAAELDQLVAGVDAAGMALSEAGFRERLLGAVFAFLAEDGRKLYWIYSARRGSFYPFVPLEGCNRRRDTEREHALRTQMTGELPLETDPDRWYAMWDIPI